MHEQVPWLLQRLAWLGLLVLFTNFAHGLAFGTLPQRSAQPGDYVTLTFALEGEGEYSFEVVSPPDWTPLTRSGTGIMDKQGFIPVTLRVPQGIRAGETIEINLKVSQGSVHLTATGRILIEALAALTVQAPKDLEGELGQPLSYTVHVSNRGNRCDTISIEARPDTWQIHVDPANVTLEPGESRAVTITVVPTTQTSDRFRHSVSLRVSSGNDPAVQETVSIDSLFSRPASSASARPSQNPQLLLKLDAGVTGEVNADSIGTTVGITYRVAPSLSGDLSDYVRGNTSTNALEGSLATPLKELPSQLHLGFAAENWDASASLGGGRYRFDTGFDLDSWRLGVGTFYMPSGEDASYALHATAISQIPDLNLQLSGRLAGKIVVSGRLAGLVASRTDTLGVHYSTPLAEGLDLSASALLVGSTTSEQDYRLTPVLSQSLNWQTQDFTVTQTYSGAPTAGIQNFGLSAGTRSLYPIGVRGSTNYQFSAQGNMWRNALTLYSRPLQNLSVTVTGRYDTSANEQFGSSWSITPVLAWSFRFPGPLSGQITGRYTHLGILSGNRAGGDTLRLTFQLTYASLNADASAEYKEEGATTANAAASTLELGTQLRYALNPQTTLGGNYGYTQSFESGISSHTFGLSWSQRWSNTFSTQLGYSRRFVLGDTQDLPGFEKVSIGLQQRDLFLDGLNLSATYSLSSPTSILDFSTPHTHNLRVGLGYSIAIPFDTPEPVTQLFGGRKGGEVYGVAFLDSNQNGRQDPGEPPLANITVALVGETTVTDTEGRYSLRVPSGNYLFAIPRLSATVELFGESSITIEENTRQEHNLPFVPVVTLYVTLFDDSNHNGSLDAHEIGIPYGGVRVEGPVQRSMRADGNGQVIISGLAAGSYTVRVDTDYLPAHYQPTTEAVQVVLQEGVRPEPVLIGAALPPREVVTTFSTNNLAVIARALRSTAPPGADVQLEALVQGNPEQVTAELGSQRVAFELVNNRWLGTVRLPLDTPLGMLRLPVRAEGGGQQVEQQVFLTVTQGQLYSAMPVVAKPGEETEVSITTLFKAVTGELLLPGGERLPLTSEDGYRWEGSWRGPATAGDTEVRLQFDGLELGTLLLTVSPPSTVMSPP